MCSHAVLLPGTTPPRFSPLPGSLPTILGSPSRQYPSGLEYSASRQPGFRHQHPVSAPLDSCRPCTVPENMAAIAYYDQEYCKCSFTALLGQNLPCFSCISKSYMFAFEIKVETESKQKALQFLNSGPYCCSS